MQAAGHLAAAAVLAGTLVLGATAWATTQAFNAATYVVGYVQDPA